MLRSKVTIYLYYIFLYNRVHSKYCIPGSRAVLASSVVFFKFYCNNCMWVQWRLFNRPYVVVRRYYCLYFTVSRKMQLTLRSTLSIFRSFFFFNGCVTFPSCWAGRITGIEEKPGKIKQKEKYVAQTIFNLGKLNVHYISGEEFILYP